MSSRAWIAATLLLIVAVALAWRLYQAQPVASALPDIVVVTFDTTRADHLGAYGYPRPTSPNFDALAQESVLFERHIVPQATTLPSHTSIFTSVFPIEHGIEANMIERRMYIPPPGLTYIAEYLASVGYDTAGIASAAVVDAGTGLERGFAHFERNKKEEGGDADGATDLALTWLRERSSEDPIFLWVHYFDPHTPLDPPEPWRDTFHSDVEHERYLKQRHYLDYPSERFVRQVVSMIDRYDEEILFMDSQFGRLIDALKRRRRWPNTVVVVAGDHGESCGQHRLWGHGRVWEEALRGPLLMRIPGVSPFRFAAPMSSVDIFPTVLGRIDLPLENEWLAETSGTDVLSAEVYEPAVLSSNSVKKLTTGQDRARSLTTARWRYVQRDQGTRGLFDLERDPFELHDVIDQHPDVAEALAARLEEMLLVQQARRTRFGGGELRAASQETVRALEALGYVDRPGESEPELNTGDAFED